MTGTYDGFGVRKDRSLVVPVPEQFLRDRFSGWIVPGTDVHMGHLDFVEQPDDSVTIPRHGVTVMLSELQEWMSANHDPGDEDRRPTGPRCSRCGDAFDGPVRDCPKPAPGRPFVDCGRGGHMLDRSDR